MVADGRGGSRPTNEVASQMLNECVAAGQSTCSVDPSDVGALRAELRRLAKDMGLKVRTADLGDGLVAIVRVNAAIWNDDTATMRRKLGLVGS